MGGSATVAERGTNAVGDDEGGSPVEAEGLPELRFVRPLPGFPQLQRFVLVRICDEWIDDVHPDAAEPAEPVGMVPAPRPASELGPSDDGRSAAGAAGEGLPLRDTPGSGSSAGEAADALVDGADASESLLFELRGLESPEVRFLVGAPAAFFSDYEIEPVSYTHLTLPTTPYV